MSIWTKTTLSDLSTDISYGYTASAQNNKVGPKFLRITDIANGRFIWNSVPYCSISKENFKKYKLYSGDIVIARTGATTGANYTIKDNDPDDLVFASYLIRYRINKEEADPFYIGYILRSPNWFDYIKAISGGSAQPGANAKQIGSFEIKLPPLPEQKAIASVLSSLDDKIDLLHRQNQTLETMAETLFRQWFVEEAEEDWEDGVLGDIMEFNYGKSLPQRKRKQGQYPVYGSQGIVDYHSDYLVKGPGIITGRKGTLGIVNYTFKDFFPIDTTFYISSKLDSANLLFEYFFLRNINLKDMNTDSAVPGLNRNLAYSLQIKIPPKNLVDNFNELVEPFYRKIKTNQNHIKTVTNIRDTLLPKLMNGKVRVKS